MKGEVFRTWYSGGEPGKVGDLVTLKRVLDETWAPRCLVVDATCVDTPNFRVLNLTSMKLFFSPPEGLILLSGIEDADG